MGIALEGHAVIGFSRSAFLRVVDLDVARGRRKLVEDAVDVLVPVNAAERLGQLNGFVDHDLVRDFDMIAELVRADQQRCMLYRRQLVDRAVDHGGEACAQCICLPDRAVQQVIEMLHVRLVKAMCFADMGIDGAGILIVQQPLVQPLQRKLARAMTRCAILVWVRVNSLLCHCLLFLSRFGEFFQRDGEVGHFDGDARRIGAFFRHACFCLLVGVSGKHRVGNRNAEVQADARDASA